MHRGLLRTAACVLLCIALALAGSVIALRAASPESRAVTLGTVDVHVAPARSGEVDVYVPVVDWGVRAKPYTAPLAVELEFRSLDRTAALAALRTGGSANASLAGPGGRAARRSLRRPAPSGCARAPRRSRGRARRRRAGRRLQPPSLALARAGCGARRHICRRRPRRRRRQPLRLRGAARADLLRPRRGAAAPPGVLGARAGRRGGLRRLVQRRRRGAHAADRRRRRAGRGARRRSTERSSSPRTCTRTASSCPPCRASRAGSPSSSSATSRSAEPATRRGSCPASPGSALRSWRSRGTTIPAR